MVRPWQLLFSVFVLRALAWIPELQVGETAGVRLNTGHVMPTVSLGTAGYTEREVEHAIILAVQAGFRGIDAAFNYYNQVGVGRALQKLNRSTVFLVTKTTPCFHPQALPHYNISNHEECRKQTRMDVEADLKQLGVEYIDLLLLHGANHYGSGVCDGPSCALNAVQWSVYEEFLEQGKVRAIGVSNFCQSCLNCLMASSRVVPAVNQIKYHVGMTADPESLVSFCKRHEIVPMAYSPLSGVLDDPLVKQIAQRHNKTSGQVALKWIVNWGAVLTTKSNSSVHLAEDVDLFSWNLTAADMSQLDDYAHGTDVPSWACTGTKFLAYV
eukprot:TRINITY_DN105342_c0_g1_i1.p1 TRINITY_DN105342_c0_g1~~TRINITY_DN105342_c0_g1_i1.p1  ORF type:complete len:339 (-),score=40.27 TRINITY_DN105342_c0_g1_i1:118-1095(-)